MRAPQDQAAPALAAGSESFNDRADEIPDDVQALEISSETDGVHVTWSTPEPHDSIYPLSFLRRASYDPPLLPTEQRMPKQDEWVQTLSS